MVGGTNPNTIFSIERQGDRSGDFIAAAERAAAHLVAAPTAKIRSVGREFLDAAGSWFCRVDVALSIDRCKTRATNAMGWGFGRTELAWHIAIFTPLV